MGQNTHHLERPWKEVLMSLERQYWLTKGQQRPMQLRDKKTYSVKDCVNKRDAAAVRDKGQSGTYSGGPCSLLAWGLLHGLKVWVGGLGEVADKTEAVCGCPRDKDRECCQLLGSLWESLSIPVSGTIRWSRMICISRRGCWEEGSVFLWAAVWFTLRSLLLISFWFPSFPWQHNGF